MKTKTLILLALLLATAALVYFHHPTVPLSSRRSETPPHRPTETPSDRPAETPSHRNTETPSHRNTETPSPRPPARLQPIFASAGEPFAARFKALETLKGPLGRDEIEALYAFLRTTGTRPGTLIGGEHVLKNGVLDTLCRQKPPPADLVSNLCALYRDGQQDSVTRDYALQHLVSLGLKGSAQPAPDRSALRETLWSALAETDTSIAGTALLGLHRLSAVDTGLDPARVSDAALKLALDPAAGELSRLTALQVCAERHLKEVLPEAAKLARQEASLPLRLAAVAALGSAGGRPEKDFLQSLQPGPDNPLSTAVTAALRRLNQRLDQTNQHDI